MTEAEHEAVSLLGSVATLFSKEICGTDETRDSDIAEFFGRIHDLQNAVLAQAAARAYPNQYRLVGKRIPRG